ncbi:hypothetical protein [Brevibacillus massiliensis]|uniref:hypothetical protein n=1 Tax=Brevibacillus massiliensis TaxID=1118054 RepID=UPI00164EA86D|nr:hypothetical protein [Brevibacillus massiliensis]
MTKLHVEHEKGDDWLSQKEGLPLWKVPLRVHKRFTFDCLAAERTPVPVSSI